MTSFEGDTGAYLQYAHVRLCSMARKAAQTVQIGEPSTVDVSLLTEPEAREIILLLATFPNVVKASFKTYEPITIVTYCFR
jgi:arginyl-tRNA synthetase